MRRDRFGNWIKFGSKHHRIVFRDQVDRGNGVADIHEVESYKKYNVMNDLDDDTFKCKCNIF